MEERDKLLTDDEEYRVTVMLYSTALAFLGDRTAEPLLIGLAENTAEKTSMRVKAVKALDFIRSDGTLRKLTSAGDCVVAAEAYKALSSRRIWDRREAIDQDLAKQALKRLEEVCLAVCREKGFLHHEYSLVLAIVCNVFDGVEKGDAPYATPEFLADMHRIMEPIALDWVDMNDWKMKTAAEFMMKPLLGRGYVGFFERCLQKKDKKVIAESIEYFVLRNEPSVIKSKSDTFLKLIDDPARDVSEAALCALRAGLGEEQPFRFIPKSDFDMEKERVRKLCTERK